MCSFLVEGCHRNVVMVLEVVSDAVQEGVSSSSSKEATRKAIYDIFHPLTEQELN